jgi:hypothetical protein
VTDLSTTIDPKSDQLNSDDLIAGPRTITVTRVVGNSDKDQPVSIFFEGDNGKPYKPCKSMRRVLVQLWGKDGNSYTGKAMTLYRDPRVKFGGVELGGVRISHLSHIESDIQLMLTSTRGKKDAFQVRRLVASKPELCALTINTIADIKAATTQESLAALVPVLQDIKARNVVPESELKLIRAAYGARQKALETLPASDVNGNSEEEDGE